MPWRGMARLGRIENQTDNVDSGMLPFNSVPSARARRSGAPSRSIMRMARLLVAIWVTTCLFMLLGAGTTQAQTSATNKRKNPNPDLVGMLTKQLNVTPEQATGGAGAIFGLAKSKLSAPDFSKVAAAVPGMSGFLKAAPSTGAAASPLDSVSGALPGNIGGLTSLAGAFQSLHLSPEMVGRFVPVIENYIASKGGSGVASVFAGALQ